ncbi:hypothetical protein PHYPSEUDO_006612 [Phytophthora pseudosyringae]|uniref:Uncharacterized protein n=1 Tax=Phytophthora pseudosyringae TaxID=221518 RepID=A0A8T1VL51_9STRA|nr:hypothetical protein PHYPSEUDO_006612 [Phytophthora pseudosyringae]
MDVIPNATVPEHSICTDPVRMATEVLKKAARVNAEPARKRLTKDYTRLSTQIVLNETAMKDSLAYVKTMRVVDEAEVEAHLSQIKELATCIDSEKQRRDTALAAVVAQEWKEQRTEFEYLVQHVDQTENPFASHEKLARIYNELSQNGVEVLALRSKLKNCLSLLSEGGGGREVHFRELGVD